MSWMPENEISDPKLIGPFWVAINSPRIPAKVRVPPGPPEVMPLTAIRARLITPAGVETVGFPVNCNEVNLKPAPPTLLWPLTSVPNRLAISKAEVDQKINRD